MTLSPCARERVYDDKVQLDVLVDGRESPIVHRFRAMSDSRSMLGIVGPCKRGKSLCIGSFYQGGTSGVAGRPF